MCEQTEISYLDGDVVWVKLGSCWWPGEVVATEKLPSDVLTSFRKPLIAVVKFFQEDTYEYVKNINSIYKYNCSRKNEFINKGLYMYRTKHGPMEKFPEDVIRAETAVGGDIEILTRDEFQETKKESYAGLFGEPKKTPISTKKGRGKTRLSESPKVNKPTRKIKEKTDYRVHILVQNTNTPNSQSTDITSNPSTSCANSEAPDDQSDKTNAGGDEPQAQTPEKLQEEVKPSSSFSTPTVSSSGMYSCHACSFSTTRLNVLILHSKTHSVTFMPYTPSPTKKKPTKASVKSMPTPSTSKTPKTPRPKKEKAEKVPKKSSQGLKRAREEPRINSDVKKPKTEHEIKSSLLADWDDVDEESNDESPSMVMAGSPEVAVAAESPAVPTPAELPSAQVPTEITVEIISAVENKSNELPATDKPESSSDSKYEFCEDEDWPVEADGGRKIPRVKKNPSKRKDEAKSLSIDDDEMAREIAELLNKTSVPELPAVPEPLKIEENFPERSIVKSPDKQDTKSPERPQHPEKASETPPTKAIFKTKTFFRSRHSRSQDAIGKYVAEQLNAVERMDMSEAEMNGSDALSSPETRESPPIEPIKVTRLAPKIQLKKMKAEAAQLREKERHDMGFLQNNTSFFEAAGVVPENTTSVRKPDIAPTLQSSPILENIAAAEESKDNSKKPSSSNLKQDVLYPTQEIRPVNEEMPEETTARTAPLEVEENLVNNEIVDTIQPKSIEIAVEVTQDFSQPDTIIEEKVKVTNNEVVKNVLEIPVTKESVISEKPYTPMNETTASAVDALLSVSREADRVTRVVSDDLPEDLFEDDNRDIRANNINDFDEAVIMETVSHNAHNLEQKDQLPVEMDHKVSEEIDHQFSEDIDHQVSEEIDHQVSEEIDHQVSEEIDHQVSEEIDHQVSEEIDHQVSEEIDHQVSEEIDHQVSEEIDQQPTQEILHHPTEDVLEQHTEVIVQQTIEEISQQPAEEIMQQPREEIILEPPDEIVHQQPKEILHQPSIEILLQPSEEISLQPAEEILLQPEEEILLQPADEISLPPAEEILLRPTEEILLQPSEEVLLQPSEEISLQPSKEILLQPSEEISLQPSEEISLKPIEEISLQPSEETMQDSAKEILQQPTDEIMIKSEVIIDKTSGYQNVNVQSYQLAGSAEQNLSDLPLKEMSTNVEVTSSTLIENVSESDLQIAEALINLPATAVQKKGNNQMEDLNIAMPVESTVIDADDQPESMKIDTKVFEPIAEKQTFKEGPLTKSLLKQDSESVNMRFETELEKNENLTAAQSLVQMSETIDHKINIVETNTSILKPKEVPEKVLGSVKQNNGINSTVSVEQKVALLSKDNSNEPSNCKPTKFETTSSKLLKILEEPCTPKLTKTLPSKQSVIPGKEKILNFDVAKSIFKPNKPKTQSPVIIRRAVNKQTLMNNMSEMTTPDKIILSRTNKPSQDGTSVQTYTIQTAPDAPSDSNTITIIQQKVRKVAKPPTKLQKIKPQNSLITPLIEKKISKETNVVEEAMFDINSMPIVLSDDILTPESIEKMPMLMSDGIISNTSNPPKLVKTKQPMVEPEKPVISTVANKPENKTLLMNPVSEVNKVASPNILSKSSKLRGAKPMLVIDKATGKQKIIMTKADSAAVKEIIKPPTLLQPVAQSTGKPEKFIILPSAASPRPGRTQKIVIDPQTGKAHVLVSKGPESSLNLNDNKPVSAKLIPSSSDAASSGNTVMIITNAQGAQSRIVLTSEHEKFLFPNKQQPKVSQLKTITHRMTTASATTQKTLISTVPQVKTLVNAVPQLKTQTRIIPKQKNAIITSKGQLIVGGRVANTAQNIAPMPEIRPLQKRIVATEPKKLVQAIQKNTSQQILKTTSQPMQKITSESLIFLQQKSGTVVQLTASQFEHFQRTGQIIQKIPVPAQEQKIVQKTITISSGEPLGNVVQRPRIRKTITESPTPAKKVKHEIAIAPAQPHLTLTPMPLTPMPALTPISNTVVTTQGPSISNTVSISTTPSYSDLDNFEEMLPSTAIARQQEPAATAAAAEPAPAQLSDGQLLAVPGEHFGGPPGSFYLCVEDSGTFTPIDNRPLVLENNQLVPMVVEPLPVPAPHPERRDILEAALANSDVFHAEPLRDEAPDFRDLNANVSVHCRVSETSTTLNQPIMTPVEVPSKTLTEPMVMPTVPTNLEDGLAVIGVTPHTVPTSLELPITVTDPRIAPKTTNPMRGRNYGTSLLTSPNMEMPYMTTEEVDVPMGGPISMPLLTDDEFVGKSMPILTDEIAERPVSSVSSAQDSPAEGEGEAEAEGGWARRLLTPGSDSSETSSEIPLQPSIQLSVSEMSRHS